MSTADQNAQLARNFLETLSAGDLERVRPLFHENATWKVMPIGIPGAGEHVGRDFIIDEFLTPVRSLFKPGSPKIEIDTVIPHADLVAVELRASGPMQNDREYNNSYCWVFEIRDGLVYVIREYMDSYYITTLVD